MIGPPDRLPAYHQLGGDGTPPGSTWGLFGPEDEAGTLNLIGPSHIVTAARLVRTGRVFPLDWSVDLPDPPILGRKATRHTVLVGETNDDRLDAFYPQRSSQWDSLAHVHHPRYGYYNGVPDDEQPGRGGVRLGIHNAARRGIVGRFVLIDVAAHRAGLGHPLDASATVDIGPAELDAVLAQQGCDLHGGDIVLFRFGWTAWYERQDHATRRRLGDASQFPTPGLAHDESVLAWLWDHGVAAIVADVPSIESMPVDLSHEDGFLHFRLIALMGMALGEMFDLEALAAECHRTRTYEGLFAGAPMNKLGGVGSPANSIAIL